MNPSSSILAVVYGGRRFGIAVLAAGHLVHAQVKCLRRCPDKADRFGAVLADHLARFRPGRIAEVIETRRPGAFEILGREIVRARAGHHSIPIVTHTRDWLRSISAPHGVRASNDGVGRRVIGNHPELGARYGPADALGRTKHPTARERHLYLLFLAVAGAEEARHTSIQS